MDIYAPNKTCNKITKTASQKLNSVNLSKPFPKNVTSKIWRNSGKTLRWSSILVKLMDNNFDKIKF